MNVYDFDNTIYDGESSFDFFLFCMKKNKRFLRILPLILYKMVKYKMCIITIEELIRNAETYAMEFFNTFPDLNEMIKEFWDLRMDRIKPYYKKQQKDDDLVISASPDFLLSEVCERLGIKNCICTRVNSSTGKVEALCFRSNKVDLFYKEFPDGVIDNFYTDSRNDKPLIKISNAAYIVKGNKIKKVK